MNTEPEITATEAASTSKIRSTLWTARSQKGKAGLLAGLLIAGVAVSACSGETAEALEIATGTVQVDLAMGADEIDWVALDLPEPIPPRL